MVIKIRHVGGVVIFDLIQGISLQVGPEETLHQAVNAQLATKMRDFLFNLQDADCLDAFNVSDILESYASIKSHGGTLKLASGKIHDLFRSLPIDPILEIYESEESALASFREHRPGKTLT